MKQTPAGKPLPPMADMWYRLRRNRAAMFGLGMIVMSILRFIWLARRAGTFRAELIRRAGVGRCGR